MLPAFTELCASQHQPRTLFLLFFRRIGGKKRQILFASILRDGTHVLIRNHILHSSPRCLIIR